LGKKDTEVIFQINIVLEQHDINKGVQ